MSTHDRSLRPAEILPPTLVPNAVALAAPSPDRLKSLLVASVIYGLLGTAVFTGARRVVHAAPATGGPSVWLQPLETQVEPEQPVRPVPVMTSGPRPDGFKAVQPRVDENVVPVLVPTSMPTTDRSREIACDPNAPVGPRVDGANLGTPQPPVPPPSVRPSGPVEVDVQMVKILTQVQPTYPALARLVKAQGPVDLRLTIDTRGVPTDVAVLSGPHPLLINEAVRVARLWRFSPMTMDGVPVAATFRLTVGFRLER